MQDGGEGLDAVDQSWAGAHDEAVGVDGPDRQGRRRGANGPAWQQRRRGGSRTEPRPPRRVGPASGGQVVSTDRAAGARRDRLSAGCVTRSGTQCPAVNGGSTHSTTATRGRGRPATARRPRPAGPQPATSRPPPAPRSAADGRIVSSTSATSTDPATARRPGSRGSPGRPRRGRGQGADPAQVLGQDQVRVEPGQRVRVQRVQVAPAASRRRRRRRSRPGSCRGCPVPRPRPSCPRAPSAARHTRTSRRQVVASPSA